MIDYSSVPIQPQQQQHRKYCWLVFGRALLTIAVLGIITTGLYYVSHEVHSGDFATNDGDTGGVTARSRRSHDDESSKSIGHQLAEQWTDINGIGNYDGTVKSDFSKRNHDKLPARSNNNNNHVVDDQQEGERKPSPAIDGSGDEERIVVKRSVRTGQTDVAGSSNNNNNNNKNSRNDSKKSSQLKNGKKFPKYNKAQSSGGNNNNTNTTNSGSSSSKNSSVRKSMLPKNTRGQYRQLDNLNQVVDEHTVVLTTYKCRHRTRKPWDKKGRFNIRKSSSFRFCY
jgi:hypothetical protein